MGFKDILLHLPDVAAASALLDAAVPMARRYGAHLIGLNVYETARPLAMVTDGYMDPMIVQRFADESRKAALENAAKVQAIFEERLRLEGISGEWRVVEGLPSATVALHARYVDVTMFSRPAGEVVGIDIAEEVLFASGRPVLVVPQAFPCGNIGQRVLIGWNATRECARAVADALPVLRGAEMVRVLTIATIPIEGEKEALLTAEDLGRHLARHGVKVSVATAAAGLLNAHDVLLNEVSDSDADLLVIGGYGHGRLRELLLGGVTRAMLRHGTGPVMLSH
ncbi:nucleotide-binding universal stress UspA family protein [Humitalea rosea]|uniref:Nucleotide-binding universal stress UspA family protein n=1 Tax=Humitalea rosea TaxID=990373 RepID=A0A2W7J6I8_9PROT|nr:universal stress protein [Humitalea rosea]PZW46822.1 nucleotide-binding universal stress UspA family protein [Humitalea rosea]